MEIEWKLENWILLNVYKIIYYFEKNSINVYDKNLYFLKFKKNIIKFYYSEIY